MVMADSIYAVDLILVAILPSPRDLEIAKVLGWYRIPLRCSPKIIDVDYLAFYQTSSFGDDHKWKIEHYAKVRGHELVRRRDLLQDQKNHPRAEEEYYKLILGPVKDLEKPILAGKWKRLTFLFTTGEKILHAESIKDLVVRDDERTIIWNSLRERAMKNEIYRTKDFPEFSLDPSILGFLGDLRLINENRSMIKDY